MRKAQPVVALLGDVVHSRHFRRQSALFRRLHQALQRTNELVESLQPVELTVGDAFQGLYATLERAVQATLILRVHLGSSPRVRIGLGEGMAERAVKAGGRAGQTGDAWWSAEEALHWLSPQRPAEIRKSVRRRPRRGWPNSMTTAVRIPADAGRESLCTAFLVCRDELLARLDANDFRILIALLAGRTQQQTADELERTQSTISERAQKKGLLALLRAHDALLRQGSGP